MEQGEWMPRLVDRVSSLGKETIISRLAQFPAARSCRALTALCALLFRETRWSRLPLDLCQTAWRFLPLSDQLHVTHTCRNWRRTVNLRFTLAAAGPGVYLYDEENWEKPRWRRLLCQPNRVTRLLGLHSSKTFKWIHMTSLRFLSTGFACEYEFSLDEQKVIAALPPLEEIHCPPLAKPVDPDFISKITTLFCKGDSGPLEYVFPNARALHWQTSGLPSGWRDQDFVPWLPRLAELFVEETSDEKDSEDTPEGGPASLDEAQLRRLHRPPDAVHTLVTNTWSRHFHAPKVTRLAVWDDRDFDGRGWGLVRSSLLENFPGLRSLVLGNAERLLRDMHADAWSDAMKGVLRLTLHDVYCDANTLRTVASGFPTLETLFLSRCRCHPSLADEYSEFSFEVCVCAMDNEFFPWPDGLA